MTKGLKEKWLRRETGLFLVIPIYTGESKSVGVQEYDNSL